MVPGWSPSPPNRWCSGRRHLVLLREASWHSEDILARSCFLASGHENHKMWLRRASRGGNLHIVRSEATSKTEWFLEGCLHTNTAPSPSMRGRALSLYMRYLLLMLLWWHRIWGGTLRGLIPHRTAAILLGWGDEATAPPLALRTMVIFFDAFFGNALRRLTQNGQRSLRPARTLGRALVVHAGRTRGIYRWRYTSHVHLLFYTLTMVIFLKYSWTYT